jgi:hypothetical protein
MWRGAGVNIHIERRDIEDRERSTCGAERMRVCDYEVASPQDAAVGETDERRARDLFEQDGSISPGRLAWSISTGDGATTWICPFQP